MAGVTGWWAETFSEPAPKVLALAGGVPGVAVTHDVYAFPTGATLTLTGSEPPVIGPPLRPGSPELTLTGGVPGIRVGNVLSPDDGEMALAGDVPTIVQSNNNLVFPTAAAGSLTGGTPTIITGPILIPTAATPSLTGGTPALAHRLVPTAATPTLAGVRPLINVTYPPPTVQLTLTGGTPRIAITVTPTGAAPTVTGGTPSIALSVAPTASLTVTGGTPRIVQTLAPPAAAPTLTGGAPLIAAKVAPTGATPSLTGGTPVVTTIHTVSFVAANGNASSSVTIPTHQVGDLIVLFAYNPFSTSAPTKPSADGTVPDYTYIDNANSGSGSGCTTAYFKATATNTTSGSWGSASHMIAVVVRDQNASSPIGGHAQAAGTSASSTAPSVTLTHTDGSSVLLHFHGHSSLGASGWDSAPAGYTRQASSGAAFGSATALNTKNITTTDGSVAQTGGQSGQSYAAATVEIIN